MGLKRPLDAEEMQECNAKHARQLSYSSLVETGVLEDLSSLCEKKPTWTNDANHVEKDMDTCEPILTGLCQEDGQSESLSHQSSGWRPNSPVEDVYSWLMNHAPMKQVPVGSNHQADIPEFVKEEILDRSETHVNNDFKRKLMGKCIIPMPASDLYGIGHGRKECLCLDKSSRRCVWQHIMEARENLIESIGHDRFMKLGFYEIGEEVATLWTEDEEDLFHKVVYSNPVSLGRDFWKQLKVAFPSRTVKELVSYYFNVFILRRRATQNRSKTLEIDSDDDEWQVEYDEENNNGESNLHEDSEDEEETSSSDDEESPINDAPCKVEVYVEDDSCTSFELQDSNLIFSRNHRSGDDLYSFDNRRLVSTCWTRKDDLLPTSNIIEEILGQDEWGDDNSKEK